MTMQKSNGTQPVAANITQRDAFCSNIINTINLVLPEGYRAVSKVSNDETATRSVRGWNETTVTGLGVEISIVDKNNRIVGDVVFGGYVTPDAKVKIYVNGKEERSDEFNNNLQAALNSGKEVRIDIEWGHPVFVKMADGKYEETKKSNTDSLVFKGNACTYHGMWANFVEDGKRAEMYVAFEEGGHTPGIAKNKQVINEVLENAKVEYGLY